MHFCIIIIIIIIIIIKHLLNEYKYEKNILQGKKPGVQGSPNNKKQLHFKREKERKKH